MTQEQMQNSPAQAEVTVPEAEAVVGEVVSSELAELQARLTAADQQAAEYKDQWLRAVADFKNLKRRTDSERAELMKGASVGLLMKVLPIVDDFERAVENIPPEIAESAWWGGTQLIQSKLRMLLESEGVTAMEVLGQDFDPNFHDAVMYEDAAGQDGKVIAELQKGYMLRDRVLRPATVKVGRG